MKRVPEPMCMKVSWLAFSTSMEVLSEGEECAVLQLGHRHLGHKHSVAKDLPQWMAYFLVAAFAEREKYEEMCQCCAHAARAVLRGSL